MVDPLLLAILFFGAAILYGSVGHAGASAYLAIMGVLSVPPDVARPTALTLNIVVAGLVTFRFWRSGYLAWRALLPFMVGSLPLAFIGGTLPVAPALYKQLVGGVLLVAAAGMFLTARRAAEAERGHAVPRVPDIPAVIVGAAIGLLAGLTGTGGGIFLSPLLLFTEWAQTKTASGIAAAFILGNSIAGLAGNVSRLSNVPAEIPLWAAAVVAGALLGSQFGSRRGRTYALRNALGLVLIVAGFKLIVFG